MKRFRGDENGASVYQFDVESSKAKEHGLAEWSRHLVALAVPFLLAGTLAASAIAGTPRDPGAYDVHQGGLVDVTNGAHVEGSVDFGGLQPDYLVDAESEPLRLTLERAKALGARLEGFWDRVGAVVALVSQDSFKKKSYHDNSYREVMRKYRLRGEPVPLSEYLICRAGVCREHALVLHLALKAAGIPSLHVYAKASQLGMWPGQRVAEDHAFVVVRHGGDDWAVDAYNPNFNGFRLQDLFSAEGITARSPRAPIADPSSIGGQILTIHAFPRIYNPKSTGRPDSMGAVSRAPRCSRIFAPRSSLLGKY